MDTHFFKTVHGSKCEYAFKDMFEYQVQCSMLSRPIGIDPDVYSQASARSGGASDAEDAPLYVRAGKGTKNQQRVWSRIVERFTGREIKRQ